MALFDFMKKKEKEEKRKHKAASSDTHTHDHKGHDHGTDAVVLPSGEHHEGLVLVSPHITEKSRDLSSHHSYVFEVLDDATKATVKMSIEQMYKVHVSDVRMITMPGKPRRRGLTSGRKKGYKKAVIRLRKGESIDLF